MRKLSEILVEDDASRYLDSLPDEERWPEFETPGLPTEVHPLTKEEREAATAIWSPKEK